MKIEGVGSHELREASASTLQELSALAGTAPPKIANMLLYIRDHLFDRSLSVADVKEKCGVRDNSIAIQFHAVLGEPPAAFITTRRLVVASRLLAETALPVWKISELLGYSSIQVFSRAFFRRKGNRPKDFRRQRHGDHSAETASPGVTAEPPDLLTQALAGNLADREAAALIRRLLEIYPPGQRL